MHVHHWLHNDKLVKKRQSFAGTALYCNHNFDLGELHMYVASCSQASVNNNPPLLNPLTQMVSKSAYC